MSTHQFHSSSSPLLARWLLSASLREAERADVLGDVEETFGSLAEQFGEREARRWYWSQVVRSGILPYSRF